MFCIGQYIMYSYSGICRVEAIGTLSFTNDSQKEYYTLRPSYTTTNAKIYVSVNTSAFMREVITREEAFLYLEYLKNMKVKVYRPKKQHVLKTYYQEVIAVQDITGYLRLLKEISQKERLVKKSGKKLGEVDLKFYRLAERMLSEELSIVLKESLESSKKRLYDIVSGE